MSDAMTTETNENIEMSERALAFVQTSLRRGAGAQSVEIPAEQWMFVLQHAEAGLKAWRAYETYKSEYGISNYNIQEALGKITDEFFEMGCIPEPRSAIPRRGAQS